MLKVLQVAQAEVGYHEQGDNLTKYAAALDSIGYFNGPKNGFAWCAVFVCAMMVEAYGVDAARSIMYQPRVENCAAGCEWAAKYYKANNAFGMTPKVGAQIFFGPNCSEHTGLVYAYNDSMVYTIEGNSGDQVARRSYARGNAWISGFGYPDYASLPNGGEAETEPGDVIIEDDDHPAPASTCTVTLPVLRNGDESEAARMAQTMLAAKGFKCGWYGADGEFGNATQKAVMAFQRDRGLDADGIVGLLTWTKLILN